jgi:uncharacterized membrane protein
MAEYWDSSSGGRGSRGSGGKVWIVLGVVAVGILAVVVVLQGMMNSHNRRRQDAIDFHNREAAEALRRAEDSLRQLGR